MKEIIYKRIANRIEEAMKKKGISYGELAALTDVPKSTLQRYVTGDTRKIPLDRIQAIADATNTSTAYLMCWEEEKPPAPEDAGDALTTDEVRKFLITYGFIDKTGSDISEGDVQFVSGMFNMLDAWFSRR